MSQRNMIICGLILFGVLLIIMIYETLQQPECLIRNEETGVCVLCTIYRSIISGLSEVCYSIGVIISCLYALPVSAFMSGS